MPIRSLNERSRGSRDIGSASAYSAVELPAAADRALALLAPRPLSVAVSRIVVMQRDRAELLRALIAYELPIEPVLADLRSFEWDAPNPLVVLTREDIVRILDRYLAGELGAAEVTDWADLIECRDDIGFPGGDEDLLSDALFRLANPNLRGDVTPELGQIIRRDLIGTHSGTS